MTQQQRASGVLISDAELEQYCIGHSDSYIDQLARELQRARAAIREAYANGDLSCLEDYDYLPELMEPVPRVRRRRRWLAGSK